VQKRNLPSTIDLASLTSSEGFAIYGSADFDQIGQLVQQVILIAMVLLMCSSVLGNQILLEEPMQE
jgi:Na+/alanine symporter